MISTIKKSYEHTIYASYGGYITQASVNNFAPLLFLTFAATFGLSLDQITIITTLNFCVQLFVDLLSAKFVDRIGYRICVVAAHICATLGLIGLAVLPDLVGNAYIGILISVVLYAIGGGIRHFRKFRAVSRTHPLHQGYRPARRNCAGVRQHADSRHK